MDSYRKTVLDNSKILIKQINDLKAEQQRQRIQQSVNAEKSIPESTEVNNDESP